MVSSSSASLSFPSWISKAKRNSENNLTRPKDHERLNYMFSYQKKNVLQEPTSDLYTVSQLKMFKTITNITN